MKTKTGTRKTIGRAHIYSDPNIAFKVEPEHIIKRNKKNTGVQEKEEESQSA
jgi:ribosomal protein S24E